MKKINIILLVLILVLGGFILVSQLTKGKDTSDVDFNTSLSEPSEDEYTGGTSTVGFEETKPTEETKITEIELHNQIKDKRFLENTYMALEYNKVNNKTLINTLKTFVDDETTMKEEEVTQLILLHEKTFLNRYMKVFVSTPSDDLLELNNEMRRVFFEMKLAYDTLHQYGVMYDPNAVNTTFINDDGTVGAGEGEVSDAASSGAVSSDQQAEMPEYDINGIPITKKSTKEANYDINVIREGIQKLERAETLVYDALKKMGSADILIEQKWLKAGLSEGEITEVMNKTNIVNPDLSEKDSFGKSNETSRSESLDKHEEETSGE